MKRAYGHFWLKNRFIVLIHVLPYFYVFIVCLTYMRK